MMDKYFKRRYPYYFDDSDYQTNSPSYYDDLARKTKLIQYLAEKIAGYETILQTSLEEIEGMLAQVIDKIGEGFNAEIADLLVLWVEDGTLDHIINETLMNKKADKTELQALEAALNDAMDLLETTLTTELKKKPNFQTTLENNEVPLKESYFSKMVTTKNYLNDLENNNKIRVATFNIGYLPIDFKDFLHDTQNFILDSKTHYLGIQEVLTNRYLNFEEVFRNQLYSHTFFSTNEKAASTFRGFDYGIASISSKSLVTKQGFHYQMLEPENYEQRGYQKIELLFNGKRISIYNTHLTHNSMVELSNQSDQLFSKVMNDPNDYHIILGDFNTVYYQYFSNFENAGYTFVNRNSISTHPSTNSSLDDIIVSPKINIDKFDVINSHPISDHHLVVAELTLN